MIRHRVHMIVNQDDLKTATSFRMDVFQAERNCERAFEIAREAAESQLGWDMVVIRASLETSEA